MFSNFFFSKIKKHNFVFNNFFLNRAVLEIMWKNTVEQDRPQMTIWRMRIAYSTPKATNTHPQYVIRAYCFTTTTMVARTCLNITLYVHCLSCLKLSALCIQIFTSNKTIWGEEPRQVVTQGGGFHCIQSPWKLHITPFHPQNVTAPPHPANGWFLRRFTTKILVLFLLLDINCNTKDSTRCI